MSKTPQSGILSHKRTDPAKTDTVSVVVPVYNSETILPELIRRLTSVLSRYSDYEIILVNDGSKDDSWDVIASIAGLDKHVHGICFLRNFGQHNALLAGVREATMSVCITMDDDLQNPPEELPKLISTIDQGFDVVYGTQDAGQYDLKRRIATFVTKQTIRHALGYNAIAAISSFRAFRTYIREAFDQYHGSFVSLDVLLSWGTSSFGTVEVEHHKRMVGKSHYTFGRLIRHTFDLVSSFSERPLQLASLMGVLLTFFGLIVFIYVLLHFLFARNQVPGFTFLTALISIFSGCQLLVLGIFGEYLSRIHFRVMEKPTYVIRRTSSGSNP